MGLRGPQPKRKVKIEWSADFAYAIGLITTDGNLAQHQSRITFVSKDFDQIENFMKCLKIKAKVYAHSSGSTVNLAYRVNVCDVLLYEFLISIGVFPTKSVTLKEIKIPDEFFFDFLRGCLDGDGCTYSYWDLRWKSSFMFYTTFISASHEHILWIQSQVFRKLGIKGHISKAKKNVCHQLRFAKQDSLVLLKNMYYSDKVTHLARKKLKIDQMLAIVGQSL